MPAREGDAARPGVCAAAHVVHRLVGELCGVEGLLVGGEALALLPADARQLRHQPRVQDRLSRPLHVVVQVIGLRRENV